MKCIRAFVKRAVRLLQEFKSIIIELTSILLLILTAIDLVWEHMRALFK